jgi:hypothetical protein
MADDVSDDRAIEVLARQLGGNASWAETLVEALASAGFQITDLTAEEAIRCVAALDSERAYLGANVVGYNDDLKAKLRALASSPSGEET